MTTDCATKDDESSLSTRFASYSRMDTFVLCRIDNLKLAQFGSVSLLIQPYKVSPFNENVSTGVSFFLFSSHTLRGREFVFLSFFIRSITLVRLITQSFSDGFLLNLVQNFINVYSTSLPNFNFKLISVKFLE